MSVMSRPKVWSRNLSEELESESKRSKLIEKQRQLLENKKYRQQQVTITATRPKSARLFTPVSVKNTIVGEDNEKKTTELDQKSKSRPTSVEAISRSNSPSSKSLYDKRASSSSSPERSPLNSPELKSKRPPSVYGSNRYDGLSRSKSISEMRNEVEMISDLELEDKARELNPLKSILNNNELLLFATQPVPKEKTYQCVIIRDKRGIDRSFYPSYYIHLQAIVDKINKNESGSSSPSKSITTRGDSADTDRRKNSQSSSLSTRNNRRQVFLLGGRRRKKSKTYLIRNYPFDISRDNCIAKLKSNVLGTQFNGIQTSSDGRRYEVVTIIYETNVLGFKGPRKMTVLLPKSQETFCYPNPSLVDVFKNDFTSKDQKLIIALKNKTPIWNDDTQSYVLNFNGRVTQASVKNFQLVVSDKSKSESMANVDIIKNDLQTVSSKTSSKNLPPTNSQPNSRSESIVSIALDDDIAMQFGRISDKEFTCDVNYPLSILQAFCIALSSFDSKLACE